MSISINKTILEATNSQEVADEMVNILKKCGVSLESLYDYEYTGNLQIIVEVLTDV